MTRFARRWVWVFVLAFATTVSAQIGMPRPSSDDTPNAATLKRLAEQLAGGNPQQPPNLDPELMKLAAEYLKKNPQLLDDPNIKQQVQKWQQQAQADPNGFAQQLKQQNPSLTPEQLQNLRERFQRGNSGGPSPPNTGLTPTIAQTTPDGQRPPPVRPGEAPPPPPPIPLPPGQQPPPGQQNPFSPQAAPPKTIGPDGGQWQSAADKAQSKTEYHQAVGLWENNFGSIEQTPAMKQALIDMFSGEGKSPWEGGTNGNNPWGGNNGKPGGQKPWDTSGNPSGQQGGFISWLKNTTSSGPPSWWKNMSSNWNNSPPPPPNLGGSGWNAPQVSGGSFSGGDVGGAVVPVVIVVGLIVAAVAGFLVWRYWPQIQAMRNQPKPIAGLGPWTIDPRDVVDRETLVKAFEYLSVLICGDGARVWNHLTIADAFRENVPGAAPFANPLARLYALARYSPSNEPIDPADIAEARGYLCRLAGVQG